MTSETKITTLAYDIGMGYSCRCEACKGEYNANTDDFLYCPWCGRKVIEVQDVSEWAVNVMGAIIVKKPRRKNE